MNRASISHRKLIDIRPAVFESLSREAARQGISLKRHIENHLESACPKREPAASGISRLIGSALPKDGYSALPKDDDRLQYLLSK